MLRSGADYRQSVVVVELKIAHRSSSVRACLANQKVSFLPVCKHDCKLLPVVEVSCTYFVFMLVSSVGSAFIGFRL